MSEKLENFERLAERRVTETIKRMRLIGNLANKRNYDYTDGHVKDIFDALENELRILKNRFKEDLGTDDYVFEFRRKKASEDKLQP